MAEAASAPFDFDLAVIGSGGGAFAAAIRATNLGKRVVMVERSSLGGTCVNTGCVPSKALLAAAEARHVALDAGGRFPGIGATASPVDMGALIGGKRALVEQMRSEKYVDLAAVTHKYPITGGHDCLGENHSCAGCALAKQAQEHLERDQ